MEPVTIRPCTVTEIESAPNIGELLAEYAQESAVAGLGEGDADWAMYHAMESAGLLRIIGAYAGATLIGFASVVVMRRPHFRPLIGSVESYFVTHYARKSGAGLGLLHAAEDLARELGAVGLFLQAPVAGRLDGVLSHMAEHTHNTYFRRFA